MTDSTLTAETTTETKPKRVRRTAAQMAEFYSAKAEQNKHIAENREARKNLLEKDEVSRALVIARAANGLIRQGIAEGNDDFSRIGNSVLATVTPIFVANDIPLPSLDEKRGRPRSV